MERIRIENLGPIKKIDLKLRQVIVLIGPQSSGKSTIAKLITIFRNYNFVDKSKSFESFLELYNIKSYVNKTTKISYESKNYSFSYSDLKHSITYVNDDFLQLIKDHEDFDPSEDEILESFNNNIQRSDILTKQLNELDKEKNEAEFTALATQLNAIQNSIITHLTKINHSVSTLKKIVSFSKYSVYIPSERNLFSILSKSIFSFLNEDILLPDVFKNFGALIERTLSKIKKIDIRFLNIRYVLEDNEHLVIDLKSKQKISLAEVSSGFQTIIPLIIAIEGFNERGNTNRTFVIEEPELNLFPKAQYELIKYIIEKCANQNSENDAFNDLIVTTHSPYCLSAFNNCILAGIQGKNTKALVSKVIPEKYWLNPDNFIAYELYNGKAKNIVDKSSKLIDENYLDEASEIINSDFNSIFELYKGSV